MVHDGEQASAVWDGAGGGGQQECPWVPLLAPHIVPDRHGEQHQHTAKVFALLLAEEVWSPC